MKFFLAVFILLSFTLNANSSECGYLFRYAGVFKDGRNPELGKRMQELQLSMGEVGQFLRSLAVQDFSRDAESFSKAYLHAKNLVHITKELIEQSENGLAPARLMTKELGEREDYLRIYKNMYLQQLRLFQIVEENFIQNQSLPAAQWNFSSSVDAFMTMNTLMTKAHQKY